MSHGGCGRTGGRARPGPPAAAAAAAAQPPSSPAPPAPPGISGLCATPILTCPSLREARHHSAAQAHPQHTERRRARVPAPAPEATGVDVHPPRPAAPQAKTASAAHGEPQGSRPRASCTRVDVHPPLAAALQATKLPPACLLPALNSPGRRPGRRTRHHAAKEHWAPRALPAASCASRAGRLATPAASSAPRAGRHLRPRDPPPPPGLAGGTWPRSAPALLLQPLKPPRREACPHHWPPRPRGSAEGERRVGSAVGSPTTRRGSSPLRHCCRAAGDHLAALPVFFTRYNRLRLKVAPAAPRAAAGRPSAPLRNGDRAS